MELILNEEQMLQEWMLRRYNEPVLRVDGSVDIVYGVDVGAVEKSRMRRWYLDLLDHGALPLLSPVDIAGEVAVKSAADGVLEIDLPAGVRRVVDVRLSCWRRPARIVPLEDVATVRRQCNPFSRGGSAMPVAVVGQRRLSLFSVPERETNVKLLSLTVVRDDGPDVYRFDDSALATVGSGM